MVYWKTKEGIVRLIFEFALFDLGWQLSKGPHTVFMVIAFICSLAVGLTVSFPFCPCSRCKATRPKN